MFKRCVAKQKCPKVQKFNLVNLFQILSQIASFVCLGVLTISILDLAMMFIISIRSSFEQTSETDFNPKDNLIR